MDYQKGDTILYPSWEDAFLTNLYLRNNDNIIQKVDTTLKNDVFLVGRQSPGKILLTEFAQEKKIRHE